MVNDQKKTNTPGRSLLHMLFSEKRALHISPLNVSPRPTRPRESKTSDFAAYYRHSSSTKCDPAYSVTSHHTRALPPHPPRPPRLLLHTYPCSAVTWNPYVQTSSLEDDCDWKDTRCVPPDYRYENDYKLYDDDSDEPPFHCRCANCTDKRCPGNNYSSFKPAAPAYRTTIMTFRDQCTMTMRLNEAATAVTPVPSYHGADESDAGCNYAVRDAPRTFTPDRGKPILKNRNDWCKEYAEYLPPSLRDPAPPRLELSPPYYYNSPPGPCSPERDKNLEDELVIEPSRLSSFFKFKKNKDPLHNDYPRRPLYNEGISDIKAGNLSCFDRRERVPSATNATKLRSKGSMKSKCCIDESKSGIPYSHHNDSKFHHDCANPFGFGNTDVPPSRRVAASSRINKTAIPTTYQNIQFMPPAKNPRKLLTSERDVDSYVEGSTYASKLKRRPKRN